MPKGTTAKVHFHHESRRARAGQLFGENRHARQNFAAPASSPMALTFSPELSQNREGRKQREVFKNPALFGSDHDQPANQV
ncbi:MAG: hypothetical protein ONB48_02930 [candidate division KSB1 bacterium]|nr:hypothetical protein [candidate division KSB1 bacterium]MDZ7284600.1 hypothetical protein [candidate division KSB1 bacterium]MDZ7297981.1 hypothetical protein [candidate division KSB1 bacterium]MDZ7305851.1 hypothetical protein [candidate division KSB1 bacterium]MDZ7348846.1 hypothetical protein [candidate division KSB1 bacterium]